MRVFFRLTLSCTLLWAALLMGADPRQQGPPAPPQVDKPPDESFVPGKPRTEPMILGGPRINKAAACTRGAFRLEFLDQGKVLEARSNSLHTLSGQVAPQPGNGPILFSPGTSPIFLQYRTLWDVRQGEALEATSDKNGDGNSRLASGLKYHKDEVGFDLRQVCRAGNVEFLLRYKAFQPGQPRKIVVVDAKTQKQLRVIGPLRANAASKFTAIADLEFTTDGTVMVEWGMANSGRSLELLFWDLDTGKQQRSWQIGLQTACTIPNQLAPGEGSNLSHTIPHLATWNPWQCQKPLYLSSDGKLLAVRDKADHIALWDTTAQKLVRNFEGYVLRGFSPNGRSLLAVKDNKKKRSAYLSAGLSVG